MTGSPGHERTYYRDIFFPEIASFELPCVPWYLLEGRESATGCTKAACDNNVACDAILEFLESLVCDNKLFTPLMTQYLLYDAMLFDRCTNFAQKIHE